MYERNFRFNKKKREYPKRESDSNNIIRSRFLFAAANDQSNVQLALKDFFPFDG